MIRFTRGNVLEAEVEALVNTVNTVGVMGKGVALMFNEAYPENFRQYAAACRRGEVTVGKMFVTHSGGLVDPRWIINFARSLEHLGIDDPLQSHYAANKYGPYANRLAHLLADLDGSYLHCTRRISDATAWDAVWFDDARKGLVEAYLNSPDARRFLPALDRTAATIEGFESPLGMELLATVDWLLTRERVAPTADAVLVALRHWPGGRRAAERKRRLFDERLIAVALERLVPAA